MSLGVTLYPRFNKYYRSIKLSVLQIIIIRRIRRAFLNCMRGNRDHPRSDNMCPVKEKTDGAEPYLRVQYNVINVARRMVQCRIEIKECRYSAGGWGYVTDGR